MDPFVIEWMCRWKHPFDHTSKVKVSHMDLEEQSCQDCRLLIYLVLFRLFSCLSAIVTNQYLHTLCTVITVYITSKIWWWKHDRRTCLVFWDGCLVFLIRWIFLHFEFLCYGSIHWIGSSCCFHGVRSLVSFLIFSCILLFLHSWFLW